MIKTWNICISGFTQTLERETGFDRLWRKVRLLANEETSCPLPFTWNANFTGLADFIFRMTSNGEEQINPRIFIFAYSWGCGHGFLKLAKELRKRGADRFRIHHAVLCDPVYHSIWRPWRAMLSGSWQPPIVAPDNVREISWFFQRQNKPQGTWIDKTNRPSVYPHVNHGVELKYNHEFMDDAIEFHEKCLGVAAL